MPLFQECESEAGSYPPIVVPIFERAPLGAAIMSSSSGVAADAGERVRFHDLVFDEGLLNAVRDDGATLRLTRQERGLPRRFTARSDRPVPRHPLLAALMHTPSQPS